MDVGKEKWFVGGAYMVPVSSSRWRRAEDLVKEMGKDIARFTEEGQVVVAGDWNCKIGRLMSVAREMEYNRRNTSKRIDGRGRRMIELMNANEMVILNGIRGSIAQNTCDGARGQGVDDYIAVSAGIVEKTSNVEYWSEMKDTVHTNHCGVACTVQVVSQQDVLGERKKRKKKKEKESFRIVGQVKHVPFWVWLQEIGEERMKRAVEDMDDEKGRDIEKYWEIFKNGLVDILHEGKDEAERLAGRKRKKGRKIQEIEEELKQLKEERRKVVGRVERK